MRMVALTLLAIAVVAASGAQTRAQPAQISDFAGTFKAEFHKQTWLTLTLIPSADKLGGTLTHSIQLSADDEGDITSVGDEMSTDTVANAELHGETLQITTRDDEGNEDRYALTLTGAETAELKPIAGDESSGPKPFKLKRVVGTPEIHK